MSENMLTGLMSWFKKEFRPATQQVLGQDFIAGDYKPVTQQMVIFAGTTNEYGKPLLLGTCAALIDLLNHFHTILKENSDLETNLFPEDTRFRVVVNRTNISAYLEDMENSIPPRSSDRCQDVVIVPFITLWDRRPFTYDQFKEFLDTYTGKIVEEDALREFMRNPKVVNQESIEIKDKGAYTEVSFGATKGIEGATLTLPKQISVEMPTGTREFLTTQKFLFRVYIANFSFELIRIENDGAWEDLLKQMLPVLEKGLPNDLILEGV